MCTENYELAQQEAVLFAKQHLALAAQNIERQQFIVPDIISCVAQAGYLGASIPQKYGGRGYDSYQLCALHEVMAGVHGSLENLITVTGMVSTLLQRVGSAAQKAHYLPKLATGELIGAIALTEPNIGSDLVNVETELQQDGDGWRLNGKKKWITLGQIADFFIVLIHCGNQLATVLIDRNTDGFTITPLNDMLGLRGNMLAELHFNDCRLKEDALLGPLTPGVPLAVNFALNEGRFTTACGSLGLCRAAVDVAARYIRQRKQFKRPVIFSWHCSALVCHNADPNAQCATNVLQRGGIPRNAAPGHDKPNPDGEVCRFQSCGGRGREGGATARCEWLPCRLCRRTLLPRRQNHGNHRRDIANS